MEVMQQMDLVGVRGSQAALADRPGAGHGVQRERLGTGLPHDAVPRLRHGLTGEPEPKASHVDALAESRPT
jgi:hypothetical protein